MNELCTCLEFSLRPTLPLLGLTNEAHTHLDGIWKLYITYVCIEVALSRVPMGSGIQLGAWRGGQSKAGPMSQPREYHWSRITHAGSYLRSRRFQSQLYSGQLRRTCNLM